ncbi:hypothetical protein glysoja_005154 [Glycine soja]|nr:hypothetical protein glysoja_005154 [Glycine soja]
MPLMSNGILFNCCNAVMGWCCHGTVAANGEHCDMFKPHTCGSHALDCILYGTIRPSSCETPSWLNIYSNSRLVVQPNTSRAHTFAEEFLACGGIETLLVLLQREAKAGDSGVLESLSMNPESQKTEIAGGNEMIKESQKDEGLKEKSEAIIQDNDQGSISVDSGSSPDPSSDVNSDRIFEITSAKNLGGISLSISADSARKNVYNADKSDGIVVGIIGLLGALVASGHLTFGSRAGPDTTSNLLGVGLHDKGGTMFEDKVSLLLYALQKAFQAAPNRLMTNNVYTALLAASINASSSEDGLNFYDSGHRFEHSQLLLVLLHSLPFAPRSLQSRALQSSDCSSDLSVFSSFVTLPLIFLESLPRSIFNYTMRAVLFFYGLKYSVRVNLRKDLLFLACSHPENRSGLTTMEEWPEWILEVLISNYEVGPIKLSDSTTIGDIEDLIHNFLSIMLEHSMRQKDGWKDIEETIHCAEWLSIVGGSSTGEQRLR